MPRRTVLLLVSSFIFVAPLSPDAVSRGATVTGASRDQGVLVAEVRSLFDEASLPLPPIAVEFHEGYRACAGQRGRHRVVAGQAHAVDVCAERADDPDQRATLVHEFAHAWAHHALTDGERLTFQTLRGLNTWNDKRVAWRDRGTEHAAEVLTWGLVRHPVLFVRIPNKSCARLAEAYEVLTGRLPRNPEHCPVY